MPLSSEVAASLAVFITDMACLCASEDKRFRVCFGGVAAADAAASLSSGSRRHDPGMPRQQRALLKDQMSIKLFQN